MNRHRHRILGVVILALCAALLLAACRPQAAPSTATPAPSPEPAVSTPPPQLAPAVGLDGRLSTGTAGMPWWNDTIFYEVFAHSFYDSNGDGIGDLNGLISKLDYLNDGNPATTDDLGVSGIWLMPIMVSPSYHGYDVSDYYKVNPDYGTNDDFKRLMQEAHKRGIYVIIDLVLNHTSSQHPWFIESRDPNSARRDWYVWSVDKPQGEGWHETLSGYYYGYFGDGMPDLNYRNPAVTEEMHKVTRFWLEDMGTDGFRLDAVKYLYEDGRVIESTPATHEWLKGFRTFYKGIKPTAMTVGEVWSDTDTVVTYLQDQLDLAFEFTLADATLRSAAGGSRTNVDRAQQKTLSAYQPGQYATFLANHDQNRTRSRVLDDEQAKLAATLQLTFPGVPFIYYGEEIGMQGGKPDENIRRPMQWTAAGGFTTGKPWEPYYEEIGPHNVAGQAGDANSLLSHYRALIRLRNSHEALRVGKTSPVASDQGAVYALVRYTDAEVILVLVNLGYAPAESYNLSLSEGPFTGDLEAVTLMGQGEVTAPQVNAAGGFEGYRPLATLPSKSSTIIRFTR